MAGFMDILGTLMQEGMAKSAPARMGKVFGTDQAEGGSFGDILSGLSGMLGGGGATPSSQQGSSGGLGGILGQVLDTLGNNQDMIGNIAALAGAIFGGGSGQTSSRAIGSGTLAMLASLAISALRSAGHKSAAMPKSLYGAVSENDYKALENEAEIIVKAMINAAKADGHIDDVELKKIIGKLEKDGLSEEERQLLVEEASKPLDINEVIRSAGNSPELAAQIYAASLLTIEVDTPAEKEYMQKLAEGLGLDPKVVEHIHKLLGV